MDKLESKGSSEGSFVLFYMGASMLDAGIVYTSSMMPWIISEILRFSNNDMVVVRVKDYNLSVTTCDLGSTPIFSCHVWEVVKCFQVALDDVTDSRHFFGIVVKTSSLYYHCRLFASTSEAQVAGIMSTMTEASKKCPSATGSVVRSNSSPKMAECVSDTISFEVLYTGKLRMSYRKAPVTFIDDALDKFKSYESERGSRESNATSNESRRSSSQESSESSGAGLEHVASMLKNIERENDESDRMIQSNPTLTLDRAEDEDRVVPKASFPHPLEDVTVSNGQRLRNPSGDTYLVKSLSLPVEPMRSRALSTGHEPRAKVLDAPKVGTQSNRTMILIIGKQEMRIISPDAKVTLFNKGYREISQIAKGIKNKECFGFICREAGTSGTTYVGYIFRCQSDSVANEILQVLRQASSSFGNPTKRELQLVCDHCPMMWYHKLCSEIDGLGEERVNSLILRRMDGLADEDRANIMAKFSGAQTQSVEEQNELMMMLLRAHCESKQLNHTHDTEENRHEFLQSYLGGGTILMKAKRSISSSFDQLIKRKEQRLKDSREINTILPHHVIHQGKEMSPSGESTKTPTKLIGDMRVSDSPLENSTSRPRSSTLGSDSGDKIRSELRGRRGSQIPSTAAATSSYRPLTNHKDSVPDPSSTYSYSPMMNIFLKVGSQKPSSMSNTNGSNSSSAGPPRQGSWRQAIFKRAVSPSPEKERIPSLVPSQKLSSSRLGNSTLNSTKISAQYRPKRSQEEFRALWKSAIKQQILLIRMEKQNHILRAKQEETNVKRNKLSYRELGFCLGNPQMAWNSIIGIAQSHPTEPVGRWMIRTCLINGIPKQMRGHVWKFIIQQNKLKPDFEPKTEFVPENTPYDQLLRRLTSHQHAILIDLGRTFPSHPYFSSPLGSGQLALFNLLKAYSLLDPEVGYCQGLSFVAGILLMHLEEEDAFEVLKYIMFNLDGRKHYKPDMSGLQLKLYQLNRLMYDEDTELHVLLYHNDVLPSLYAAPWLLTMFASQFSIGFAARVMDMVLLSGVDVLIKLALVVIQDFKPQLIECRGLEQIMECFKTTVTQISSAQMDMYLNTILGMDEDLQPPSKPRPALSWNTNLRTYAIEYDVLTDETFMDYLSNPIQDGRNKSKLAKCYKTKAEEEEEMDSAQLKVEKEGLERNVKLLVNYVQQLEFILKCRNEKIPLKPESLTTLLGEPAVNGNGNCDLPLKKKLILPAPSDYTMLTSSVSPPAHSMHSSGDRYHPAIPSTIDEDGFRAPPARTTRHFKPP